MGDADHPSNGAEPLRDLDERLAVLGGTERVARTSEWNPSLRHLAAQGPDDVGPAAELTAATVHLGRDLTDLRTAVARLTERLDRLEPHSPRPDRRDLRADAQTHDEPGRAEATPAAPPPAAWGVDVDQFVAAVAAEVEAALLPRIDQVSTELREALDVVVRGVELLDARQRAVADGASSAASPPSPGAGRTAPE